MALGKNRLTALLAAGAVAVGAGGAAVALEDTGSATPAVAVAQTSVPPGAQTLGVGQYSATFHWAGVTEAGQTGYYVYQNGTQVADVATPSYTFTNLACGTTFTFGVAAHDGSGSVSPTSTTTYSTPSCGGGGGGGGGTLPCDISATTSNFAAQIASAATGKVVCLASGDYSSFAGTSKTAPGITITSAPGATVTFNSGMTLNLSTVQNFTLDGTGAGGTMTVSGQLDLETSGDALLNKALNLTFQNLTFAAGADVLISGPENSNITLNRNVFIDSNHSCASGSQSGLSEILLNYATATTTTPSGLTVENSVFVASTDLWNPGGAMQTAAPISTLNNVFTGYLAHAGPGCTHIDTEQAFSGVPGFSSVGTFAGNLCFDDFGCLMAFDGISLTSITDNVCFNMEQACAIMYADTPGSTVDHNVQLAGGADPGLCNTMNQPNAAPVACTVGNVFENGTKSGYPSSSVETLTNNVSSAGPSLTVAVATNSHNLYPGASSPNISGTPTFAAGAQPTTWAGFGLTAGSTGHAAGLVGLDVGIRLSAGGPPTGGGSAPLNTVAPTLSGSPTNGSTLTTTDGTWTVTGNVPTATTYQWFDCPTSTFAIGSCPALQSFNPGSSTNTGTMADNLSTWTLNVGASPSGAASGHFIFAMVTKTNANGQVNAISNAIGPVS